MKRFLIAKIIEERDRIEPDFAPPSGHVLIDRDLIADPMLGIVPVPTAVTRRQLRLWLVRAGIALARVEALIEAMAEPQRSIALIEWHDAATYERANPLVEMLGQALGFDGAALDNAFTEAAQL